VIQYVIITKITYKILIFISSYLAIFSKYVCEVPRDIKMYVDATPQHSSYTAATSPDDNLVLVRYWVFTRGASSSTTPPVDCYIYRYRGIVTYCYIVIDIRIVTVYVSECIYIVQYSFMASHNYVRRITTCWRLGRLVAVGDISELTEHVACRRRLAELCSVAIRVARETNHLFLSVWV